jgi:hypothetical protein
MRFAVRFQHMEPAFLDLASQFLEKHCGASTHPASPTSKVRQEAQGDAASVFRAYF